MLLLFSLSCNKENSDDVAKFENDTKENLYNYQNSDIKDNWVEFINKFMNINDKNSNLKIKYIDDTKINVNNEYSDLEFRIIKKINLSISDSDREPELIKNDDFILTQNKLTCYDEFIKHFLNTYSLVSGEIEYTYFINLKSNYFIVFINIINKIFPYKYHFDLDIIENEIESDYNIIGKYTELIISNLDKKTIYKNFPNFNGMFIKANQLDSIEINCSNKFNDISIIEKNDYYLTTNYPFHVIYRDLNNCEYIKRNKIYYYLLLNSSKMLISLIDNKQFQDMFEINDSDEYNEFYKIITYKIKRLLINYKKNIIKMNIDELNIKLLNEVHKEILKSEYKNLKIKYFEKLFIEFLSLHKSIEDFSSN